MPRNVPVVRVNTDELRRRVAVARASGPRGAEEGAKVMASVFTDFVVLVSVRDTNRFVNGFIMAAAQIGATSKQPFPVRESRYRAMIENILREQVVWLGRRVRSLERTLERWYYDKGRSGPWLTKKERELRKLKKRLDRAREELELFLASPTAIGIDLFSKKHKVTVDDSGDELRFTIKETGGRLATVRTKLYGGTGALLRSGRRVFVRLHNLEAHASFVDRKHRIVARAMAELRRVGVRRASKKYLETQAIAGGLRLSVGTVEGSRGLPKGRVQGGGDLELDEA